MGGRIKELDVLRALAFIAVAVQHVLGYYWQHSMNSPTDSYFIALSFAGVKFAVPLFVFLTGYLVFGKEYRRFTDGDFRYGKFLLKRAVIIGVPFLLASIYYAYEPVVSGRVSEGASVVSFIEMLIQGSAKYHLWYVSMLFQLIILMPLLMLFYKKISDLYLEANHGWILILGFGLIYLLYTSNYLRLVQPLGNEEAAKNLVLFYSNGFVSYLPYFYLGAYAGVNQDQWTVFIKKHMGAISILTVTSYVFVVWFGLSNSQDLVSLNLFGTVNPRFFVFTMFSIMFLYGVSLKVRELKKATLISSFIGHVSFMAYLVHAEVLYRGYLLSVKHTGGIPVPVYYSLLAIVVVVVSLAIGWLLTYAYGYLTALIFKKARIR